MHNTQIYLCIGTLTSNNQAHDVKRTMLLGHEARKWSYEEIQEIAPKRYLLQVSCVDGDVDCVDVGVGVDVVGADVDVGVGVDVGVDVDVDVDVVDVDVDVGVGVGVDVDVGADVGVDVGVGVYVDVVGYLFALGMIIQVCGIWCRYSTYSETVVVEVWSFVIVSLVVDDGDLLLLFI